MAQTSGKAASAPDELLKKAAANKSGDKAASGEKSDSDRQQPSSAHEEVYTKPPKGFGNSGADKAKELTDYAFQNDPRQNEVRKGIQQADKELANKWGELRKNKGANPEQYLGALDKSIKIRLQQIDNETKNVAREMAKKVFPKEGRAQDLFVLELTDRGLLPGEINRAMSISKTMSQLPDAAQAEKAFMLDLRKQAGAQLTGDDLKTHRQYTYDSLKDYFMRSGTGELLKQTDDEYKALPEKLHMLGRDVTSLRLKFIAAYLDPNVKKDQVAKTETATATTKAEVKVEIAKNLEAATKTSETDKKVSKESEQQKAKDDDKSIASTIATVGGGLLALSAAGRIISRLGQRAQTSIEKKFLDSKPIPYIGEPLSALFRGANIATQIPSGLAMDLTNRSSLSIASRFDASSNALRQARQRSPKAEVNLLERAVKKDLTKAHPDGNWSGEEYKNVLRNRYEGNWQAWMSGGARQLVNDMLKQPGVPLRPTSVNEDRPSPSMPEESIALLRPIEPIELIPAQPSSGSVMIPRQAPAQSESDSVIIRRPFLPEPGSVIIGLPAVRNEGQTVPRAAQPTMTEINKQTVRAALFVPDKAPVEAVRSLLLQSTLDEQVQIVTGADINLDLENDYQAESFRETLRDNNIKLRHTLNNLQLEGTLDPVEAADIFVALNDCVADINDELDSPRGQRSHVDGKEWTLESTLKKFGVALPSAPSKAASEAVVVDRTRSNSSLDASGELPEIDFNDLAADPDYIIPRNKGDNDLSTVIRTMGPDQVAEYVATRIIYNAAEQSEWSGLNSVSSDAELSAAVSDAATSALETLRRVNNPEDPKGDRTLSIEYIQSIINNPAQSAQILRTHMDTGRISLPPLPQNRAFRLSVHNDFPDAEVFREPSSEHAVNLPEPIEIPPVASVIASTANTPEDANPLSDSSIPASSAEKPVPQDTRTDDEIFFGEISKQVINEKAALIPATELLRRTAEACIRSGIDINDPNQSPQIFDVLQAESNNLAQTIEVAAGVNSDITHELADMCFATLDRVYKSALDASTTQTLYQTFEAGVRADLSNVRTASAYAASGRPTAAPPTQSSPPQPPPMPDDKPVHESHTNDLAKDDFLEAINGASSPEDALDIIAREPFQRLAAYCKEKGIASNQVLSIEKWMDIYDNMADQHSELHDAIESQINSGNIDPTVGRDALIVLNDQWHNFEAEFREAIKEKNSLASIYKNMGHEGINDKKAEPAPLLREHLWEYTVDSETASYFKPEGKQEYLKDIRAYAENLDPNDPANKVTREAILNFAHRCESDKGNLSPAAFLRANVGQLSSEEVTHFEQIRTRTLERAEVATRERAGSDDAAERESKQRAEKVAHMSGLGEHASKSTEQLTAAGLRKQVIDLIEARKKEASDEEKPKLEQSLTWINSLSDAELHEHAVYISHNRAHFTDKESMLKHREALNSGEREREGTESKGRGSVMLIDTLVGLGFKLLAP